MIFVWEIFQFIHLWLWFWGDFYDLIWFYFFHNLKRCSFFGSSVNSNFSFKCCCKSFSLSPSLNENKWIVGQQHFFSLIGQVFKLTFFSKNWQYVIHYPITGPPTPDYLSAPKLHICVASFPSCSFSRHKHHLEIVACGAKTSIKDAYVCGCTYVCGSMKNKRMCCIYVCNRKKELVSHQPALFC